MFVWFLVSTLFCIYDIKADGLANDNYFSDAVELTVEVSESSATITFVGPTDVWYGVGFGVTEMDNSKAFIVYEDSNSTENDKNTVKEWLLGYHSKGTEESTQIDADVTVADGNRTAIFTISSGDQYDTFPSSDLSIPVDIDIIIATGEEADFATTTYGMRDWGSFEFNFINPDYAPSTTGSDTQVLSTSSDSAARCFSSDSYVLTDGYQRKQISDLNIYDKILTFDSLNNKYIWDELLVKLHFNDNEYLNNKLIPMIEFRLNNNNTLTMTDNHLLYIDNELHRADEVKIGDKLKQYDGSNVIVIDINKNIMKYPRNLITYNGNLVINGIAISTFTDTIWGESEYWGKSLRFIMKYFYSYNIWRYPAYYAAKLWTEYLSFDTKQYVLGFYFDGEKQFESPHWYYSFFTV